MSELDLILKDVENYYKKSKEKHYNIVKDLRNQPLFTFDTLLKFTAMYKYERANEANTSHDKALDIDFVSGCLPDESELAEAVDTAIYKSDCSTKLWIKEFKEQLKLSGYEIIETNNR